MADATRIHVATASPYDVVVGEGVLGEAAAMLGEVQRVAICSPAPLQEIADRVAESLSASQILRIELPDGEAAKTATVAAAAWEQLGAAGFTRSDAVVTVGGGATTDMGGFIAATWLRGVRVVHVPTTVLAMVDAAVGGKTGMNTAAGKNLVGAFHEPAGVVCDLSLLETLPPAEYAAGMAEALKCGFIADPAILATSDTRELVERAIRVKAEVVAGDLKETGGVAGHPGREVLNYGHTLAHALETTSNYTIRHGEAVAIGCCYAAELARLAGHEDLVEQHRSAFAAAGLPTTWQGAATFADLLSVMRVDKKARGNTLRFIVLAGLARPVVLTGPEEKMLREAFEAVTP